MVHKLTAQKRAVVKRQIAGDNPSVQQIVNAIESQARFIDPAAHRAADFYLLSLRRLNLTPNQVLALYHHSSNSDDKTKLKNMLAIICLWVDTEVSGHHAVRTLTRSQILRFINDKRTLRPTDIRTYCRRTFG